MKVKINSKKNLKVNLIVTVGKSEIKKKMEEKLNELKTKVNLKGFRPGKVPPKVIKDQFGKAIYGEVVDTILKETSTKALEDNKLKVVGQPKIDLKTFGEGKDLNYTIEVETFPEFKIKSLEKIKATNYKVIVDDKIIDIRLKEIAKGQQNFIEKNNEEKSKKGDQITFDYVAKIDGKNFEGGEGKNIQLILGRDLFIKGFDEQLIGLSKNNKKVVTIKLPENYPKKELVNKKTDFYCTIINLKKPSETKIDDSLAKKLGAKDIKDLKDLISKQISNDYKRGLENILKKNILDQLEKSHDFDLPPKLVEDETNLLIQNLKKDDQQKNFEKNKKIAKSRIKIGFILNQIAEKNNLKINDEEIKNQIQKQAQNMPGQEKMVIEYYQKNPSAVQSLKSALYEEKIIEILKNKINLLQKNVSTLEADEIIKKYMVNQETKIEKNHKKLKNKKKSK